MHISLRRTSLDGHFSQIDISLRWTLNEISPCMYISHIYHVSLFIWFAQPGSWQKQDNFYRVNTPSHFSRTILPWICRRFFFFTRATYWVPMWRNISKSSSTKRFKLHHFEVIIAGLATVASLSYQDLESKFWLAKKTITPPYWNSISRSSQQTLFFSTSWRGWKKKHVCTAGYPNCGAF